MNPPHIAAKLAWEKNTLIRKHREMVAMEKQTMKRNSKPAFDRSNTCPS